jgi:hypothetical protein
MIDDTIGKIESKLQSSETIKPETKAELLKLFGELKGEVNRLASTNAEGAQSVASFTEVSAYEATRSHRNPELVEYSVGGLSKAVEEFEESHPQLVAVVNRLCTALSNMGV